jgi:hypothetical protein
LETHPELAGCAVDCKHCGIRFFTHPRNANREDLRCPFGCREHHRRELSRERSRRHYQKPEAKTKKAFRNAQRSFPANFDDAKFSVNGSLSPTDNPSPSVDSPGNVDDVAHVNVARKFSCEHCRGATREGNQETRDESAFPAGTLPTVAPAEGREARIAGVDRGLEGDRSLPDLVSPELPAAKPCRTDLHGEATNIENPEEALLNLEISLEGVVLDGASIVKSPILPYVRMVVTLIAKESISKNELFAGLLKIVSQRSIDQQTTTGYISRSLDQHPP